jgi:hypothetical protein
MNEKIWECVQVGHHTDIGKTIEEYQKEGWRLHTYQAAGLSGNVMTSFVNHYLLFEREG